MQKTFIVRDEAETTALAERFTKIVKKGDVLALYGTLGMGKSVFARGLIQKLTDAEEVPSPTFTLVQGYDAPQFEIYHFDLYRLKDPDEVFELGFEEAVYGGVCLIEWPEKAGNWLPKDIFKLEITPYASGRKITVDVSSEDKIKRLEQI
jgi:tRNA threonylcarbamoyl adenosine modification protein YjeE